MLGGREEGTGDRENFCGSWSGSVISLELRGGHAESRGVIVIKLTHGLQILF